MKRDLAFTRLRDREAGQVAPRSGGVGPSRERALLQARWFGLILRHTVNVLCGGIYFVQPDRTAAGTALATALVLWGAYRLATRNVASTPQLLADYGLIIVVAATIAQTIGPLTIGEVNSLPLAVCGSGVLSFGFSQRGAQSAAATAGICLAFLWGASQVPGIESPFALVTPYKFVIQLAIAVLIRRLVLHSAQAADDAAEDHAVTQRGYEVAAARRAAQHEHWATVHDTAAATMLMVGQGVPVAPDRLRRQAARDLQALAAAPVMESPEDVDLAALLRDTITESPLTITAIGPWTATASTTVALAVHGAVREALTNVERHSGTTAATVSVHPSEVRISDRGRGFLTDRPPTTSDGKCRGVRESIVARMRMVGGAAVISSKPGAGTTVLITWTPSDTPEPETADPAERASRLKRGFGLGLVAVALTWLTLFPFLNYGPGIVTEPVQLAVIGVLLAVTALGTAGLLGRPLSARVRLLGVLTVCAVTFLHPLTLSSQFGDSQHWVYGMSGWVILPLILDSGPALIVSALTANWIMNFVAAAATDKLDTVTLVIIGYTTAGVLVMQLIAGAFAVDLRRNAHYAAQESAMRIKLIAQREIAERVQADYRSRYQALAATTVPLLTQLADGSITATTPGVRERAAVESARMRRLFAQTDGLAQIHCLAVDIQELTASAETRGVSVSLDIPAALPPIDASTCRALLTAPTQVIETARTHARVVVTISPRLQISVVTDTDTAIDLPSVVSLPDVDVRLERDGDHVWVQSTDLSSRTLASTSQYAAA